MRVEGIELHRLLTSVGQGDVDATILRQVNGGDVAQDLRSLFIRQFRIALDELFYIILREQMRLAKSDVSIEDSGTPCWTRKFLTVPTRRSESACCTWLLRVDPRGR